MALIDEREKIFSDIPIDFHKEDILKVPPFSNWIKAGASKAKFEELLEKMEPEVGSYLSPKGMLRIIRRNEADLSPRAPPELLEADLLAIGVATIGEGAERHQRRGNLFEGLVTDALENVALLRAERQLVEFVRGQAEAGGLNLSRVIPPGSGRTSWSIENQRLVFQHLDAGKIGVRLSPSYSMKPQKSVSFVMGLGRNIEPAKNLYSCEGCRRLDCSYRTTQ